MYYGERFNSISHLLGVIAALVGAAILVTYAAQQGDPWKIVSFSVYGATLFLLYLFSTLYHSFRGKWKAFFKKLDHHAIYLLIAGTYTPFTLVTLNGAWGWTIFGIVWGLAIVGIVIDSLPMNRGGRRIIPLVIYLVMGWICVIAIKPLLEALPEGGFALLLLGGILYTLGIVFYLFDEKVAHFHGIWHLFVLGGSVSHYLSVLYYVA